MAASRAARDGRPVGVRIRMDRRDRVNGPAAAHRGQVRDANPAQRPSSVKTLLAIPMVAAAIALVPAQAQAKPCSKHSETTKVTKTQCQKQHERQVKRDRMKWPPKPSEAEIIKRIGISQWRKAERISVCETGGNWQHYPHGRWIGGMGMYRSTYGIGQAVTRYRWVHEGATKAEQIAIAYIVQQRFGWSAWGCGSA